MFSFIRAYFKKADFWPEVAIAFGIFCTLRLLSWAVSPFPLCESLVGVSLVALVTTLFLVKKEYGYIAVFGELILGGSGHLFDVFGLSLRTVLLFVSILFMLFQKEYTQWTQVQRRTQYLVGALIVWVGVASIFGLVHGHGVQAVYQDALPFAYLVFIPTLISWWRDARLRQLALRILVAALIGHTLFSLLTLGLFSSHIVRIQDPWYKWIRDVLMGKVTDMTNGFFRVVLPDHLLVVPALVGVSVATVTKKIKTSAGLLATISLLIILAINFSRTYYIALVCALIAVWATTHIKRSLLVTISMYVLAAGLFLVLNLAASHGQSTGLELVSARFGGIVRPHTEESAYTRKALLTPITEKIIAHPVLGNGFGETVTIQTNDQAPLTTRQFDWGWLELLTETGLVGVIIIGVIYSTLARQYIRERNTHVPFARIGLGVVLFLTISTIFMPAMFHVYGILLLGVCIAYQEAKRI